MCVVKCMIMRVINLGTFQPPNRTINSSRSPSGPVAQHTGWPCVSACHISRIAMVYIRELDQPLRSPKKDITHAGQPKAIANAARIVQPLPYPNLAYMAGAKSGKPKPARERRQDTAASADAACSVKLSTTYVWMLWKFRIIPAPTHAMPWHNMISTGQKLAN